MYENDDVFMEANICNTKDNNLFPLKKKKDDSDKLSPLPWRMQSRKNSNSSSNLSSRPSSNSSQSSFSPSRRFSVCSSLLTSPSSSHNGRRASLMGSLEIIFGTQSTSPAPPAFHFKFLGQIYRNTLERRAALESDLF